ncbi:hypothetical protein SAY87_020332 [Trapa incisa]|uniref:Uncharacterized protein n=1 Tax=Trapa incisa TaxID=236973 RepID=A0AAN7Q3M7_9MYRT|nr:hypothetical protein SAY87_020332 [Trapa incisa]
MLPSFDPQDMEAGLSVIEYLTTNANLIQDQLLKAILAQNARTEYLSRLLDGQLDKEAFKRLVPVAEYEDIKPYMERIANGEPSDIISSQPIIQLLISSGTSRGQPKILPLTSEELDRKTFFHNLLVPVMYKYVEGLDQGKAMYLLFIKQQIRTSGGLIAQAALTSYYKSSNFLKRPYNRFNIYTSPDEAILCPDVMQSMYCQLLCGLIQRHEVLRIGAVFASAFLRAIKFLEANWEEMCSNIRIGQVSGWITNLPCRSVVSSMLIDPNPDLAISVEKECGSGRTWEGIIKRLWPRTKYIEVVITGSMAQYIPMLEFYSGGIPLVDGLRCIKSEELYLQPLSKYASSESHFGINLQPLSKPSDISYTFLPNMAYFEFLPLENSQGVTAGGEARCKGNHKVKLATQTVDLVDVKLGHYYELIVTTFTGLYRYRVGDILMVTGFHNKAPQFRFVQRQNVMLSIDTDKTSEEDLLKAVTKAKEHLEQLGLLLTEYTSYPDTSSFPGHYVIYWELKAKGCKSDFPKLDKGIMEKCCSTMEESLDLVYRFYRRKEKSIGPLEIRVVREGTFDTLMDYYVMQGSSMNQYKMPRCIKSEELYRIEKLPLTRLS